MIAARERPLAGELLVPTWRHWAVCLEVLQRLARTQRGSLTLMAVNNPPATDAVAVRAPWHINCGSMQAGASTLDEAVRRYAR